MPHDNCTCGHCHHDHQSAPQVPTFATLMDESYEVNGKTIPIRTYEEVPQKVTVGLLTVDSPEVEYHDLDSLEAFNQFFEDQLFDGGKAGGYIEHIILDTIGLPNISVAFKSIVKDDGTPDTDSVYNFNISGVPFFGPLIFLETLVQRGEGEVLSIAFGDMQPLVKELITAVVNQKGLEMASGITEQIRSMGTEALLEKMQEKKEEPADAPAPDLEPTEGSESQD